MSVLDRIIESSEQEVSVADPAGGPPWRFKLRKGTSRDIFAVGGQFMNATIPVRDGEHVSPPTDHAEQMAESKMLLDLSDVWARACVIAVHDAESDEWAPMRFVADEGEEDRAASPAKIWIERFPLRARMEIGGAAMTFSASKEADAEALRNFRERGSKPAASRGRAGKAVRKAAARNR